MKVVDEVNGCILMDCPRCGEWIDADSDVHEECGWDLAQEKDDVQEP